MIELSAEIRIVVMTVTYKNLLLLTCLLALPCAVFAEELTVQDTSGFTRAASEVDGSGQVDFALVSETGAAADGAVVTLTNAATGEVLTTTAVGGTASFQGVTAGVWTVATAAPGITFTSVSVIGGAAIGAAGFGTAAIGAAVVGGGGAAAAIGINESKDDDDELSPSS